MEEEERAVRRRGERRGRGAEEGACGTAAWGETWEGCGGRTCVLKTRGGWRVAWGGRWENDMMDYRGLQMAGCMRPLRGSLNWVLIDKMQ